MIEGCSAGVIKTTAVTRCRLIGAERNVAHIEHRAARVIDATTLLRLIAFEQRAIDVQMAGVVDGTTLVVEPEGPIG